MTVTQINKMLEKCDLNDIKQIMRQISDELRNDARHNGVVELRASAEIIDEAITVLNRAIK